MQKKIPVYLCHTNILSGVTSWGLELRAAFKEHEKYEFVLVNLWRDHNDKFDLNLNNIHKLFREPVQYCFGRMLENVRRCLVDVLVYIILKDSIVVAPSMAGDFNQPFASHAH